MAHLELKGLSTKRVFAFRSCNLLRAVIIYQVLFCYCNIISQCNIVYITRKSCVSIFSLHHTIRFIFIKTDNCSCRWYCNCGLLPAIFSLVKNKKLLIHMYDGNLSYCYYSRMRVYNTKFGLPFSTNAIQGEISHYFNPLL